MGFMLVEILGKELKVLAVGVLLWFVVLFCRDNDYGSRYDLVVAYLSTGMYIYTSYNTAVLVLLLLYLREFDYLGPTSI